MIKSTLFYIIIFLVPAVAASQSTELRHKAEGFHADWFKADEPNGSALIILGGSEGGNEFGNLMAPFFQSKGYHVLSLAFFKSDGLNNQLEKIPVETLHQAVNWIYTNHGNNVKKVGLMGGSKGAELALIAATLNLDIDALVLISPSSVVWQSINDQNWQSVESSWTFENKPLPFLRYDFSRGVERIFDFYDAAIDNLENSQAIIKAENVTCPVIIFSGENDAIWPSKKMAGMITSRLEEAEFAHPFFHYNYEDAGHLLIHPAVFDDDTEWPGPSSFDSLGGSPESFPEIARQVLENINEFLHSHL